MDASRLLLLVVVVISTSEWKSEASGCVDLAKKKYNLLEGEAFYIVPFHVTEPNDGEFTWFKSSPQSRNISSKETERVHYHGGALFFFDILPTDAGNYTCQKISPAGECYNRHVEIRVFNTSFRADKKLTYGEIKNSDDNKKIHCPIADTCKALTGNFTWYKDFILLPDEHEAFMWVENAIKEDEGIYTCVCTWRHNHKLYNSSGSRRLIIKEKNIFSNADILSPTNKVQFADEGHEIKLNCSVYCGKNARRECHASWSINGIPVINIDSNRYNQTTNLVMENPSKNTIATSILTIKKVSAKDFEDKFECFVTNFYRGNKATLTLQRRASIIPLVIGGVCVLFFCVFAAMLVKFFAIDLALFFRPYLPLSKHNDDKRIYDAYVVYQMQKKDKATEETLSRFVTTILPSVLENKCGYRLFIHGRDDIPGEDRLELVEDRMKQSRRLMVILTPGSESGPEITDQSPASPQTAVLGGFDWQVGLHHALIQREMSVILIQLGDTGPQGYTNFPLGLQHLILKSAPLRWPESSRRAAAWNSHFWKRVRYLMPVTPAKKHMQSAIV
ncbi:interleukin-1 receptor-like 1 isoform X1 [Acanthochromis polyacanthus]|uniref:interleukin-1 receptor-like 1 isoform X1 n=1 Tax=Acanthochromis polyacanthus TaxID=80966 RepID=UPI002233FEFA|nr:interleukin-1 receptor-like 1 isoform X1 [Acanthochromis polyacanthus]